MANKTNYDRSREYLDYVANIANDYHTLRRVAASAQDDIEDLGLDDTIDNRLDEYRAELVEAESILSKVGGVEGNALVCRYIYLFSDRKLMRTIGYSKTGCRKVLDRGIKALYEYLPAEYCNPLKNRVPK